MPIIETKGVVSSQGYGQFARSAAVSGTYIEDVFSTTLYTGTGAARSIANGIALGTGATSAGWFANTFGTGSVSFSDVATDSSGNSYACGSSVISAVNTAILIKFSPSGAVLWQTSLPSGTSAPTTFNGVAVGPSGDVYLSGEGRLSGTPSYFVVKYNSSGVLQWQRLFSQTGFAITSSAITVDSSDFVYVTGGTNSNSFITTVKLNSSGAIQWQVRYSGEFNMNGNGIAVDASGNVHVVGTEGYTVGEDAFDKAVILKYNSSGTLLWQRAIGSSPFGSFTGRSCSLDSSGNVYVTVHGNTSSNILVCKLEPSGGSILWYTTFSTTALQRADVVTTAAGNSYVCVRTGGAINNGFVISLDTSGTLLWQRRIQTSFFNEPLGIALSGASSLVVVGDMSTTIASAFVARLPTDGSGTGAYTLNGQTISYVVGAEASGSTSRAGTTGGSSSAGNLISNTSTFTDTPTFFPTALTPLAQGAGRGGLVWMKSRSATNDHALYDTTRGATADLVSNSTAAQTTQAQGLTAFLGSGFSIGTLAKLNTSAAIYAAWTFAKQPKFFDVVTYTGNGSSSRTISHNLNATPGAIIIKSSANSSDWLFWHRSLTAGNAMYLNLTFSQGSATPALGSPYVAPTDTAFTVGNSGTTNSNGATYVAYLFAHDAGGFGASGTDNVISCGSYTGNGSASGPIVTLGWEPQWILLKAADSSGNWVIVDNMRGLVASTNQNNAGTAYLYADSNSPEFISTSSVGVASITPTGFQLNGGTVINYAGQNHIYIAIRRGPMRTPTSGTSVFSPIARSGTGGATTISSNNQPDAVIENWRSGAYGSADHYIVDRLRGVQKTIFTNLTAAEATQTGNISALNNVSYQFSGTDMNASGGTFVDYSFTRAPGFFDVVCYTGTGANLAVNHNLGVAPEMMIAKRRNSSPGSSWGTAHIGYGSPWARFNGLLYDAGRFDEYVQFYQNPTNTQFFVTTEQGALGGTYVAYLFASCPGVSKVGSYTGTGSTVQVNCGFAAGARFVLIKRADAAGDWYVWDSARGIVAANDPYLRLNSTAAEVTSTDWVDTLATGFEVSNAGSNLVNVNGGTYIFLAIA